VKWDDYALCKGKHLDIWYPPIDALDHNRYYTVAKWVCERCPVKDVCFDEGQGEEFGCWGGQTPKERRKGVVRPPRKYLLDEGLSIIPDASNAPLDIDLLRLEIAPFTKRRPPTKPVE
jgi:hypothetical protein